MRGLWQKAARGTWLASLGRPRDEATVERASPSPNTASASASVAPFLEDHARHLDAVARNALPILEAIVEVTNACNLRCTMCAVSSPSYGPVGLMDERTFERASGVFPHVRTASLYGHGEPMLHPKLLDWCATAKSHGVKVALTSNGTLLTEATSRALVDLGVDELTISLDGATPETFDAIRGTSLSRILDNVRRLVAMRDAGSRGLPSLAIQAVAMAGNAHEMPALVDLAADLGAYQVRLRALTEHNLPGEALGHDPSRHGPSIAEAEARARARGIGLLADGSLLQATASAVPAEPSQTGSSDGVGRRRACRHPWRMSYIRYDGTVRPCCGSERSLGSLHESTFEEIWNGPRAVAFRRAVASREQPPECAACPLAPMMPPTPVHPWLRVGKDDVQLGDGWHAAEDPPSLRWSSGTATLYLWRAGTLLHLNLQGYPKPNGLPPLRLTVRCDGRTVHEETLQDRVGPFLISVPLPGGPDVATIELITDAPWSPREAGLGKDDRRFGVALFEAWVAPG